jgi:DNA polymerase-3 subunit gamma/tau
MAYRALYRTWRPRRFADVVGQEPITRVLSGEIENGKIAHAYLFSGPRGTGKTSLAKIFARAVNCQNRQGAEPCGECESCRAIAEDGSVDIVEIDAASNTGVDNIRDIRDRVNLLPAFCAYKVYIIDEVHMLSKGAFNALLKTLEEPPSHVIFILATTEPHKLPATILSRCQRFDFQRIPASEIQQRLAEVAQAEGFVYEDSALKIIARTAEGGMRDALSILDQCAAFGDITAASVAAALGSGDMRLLYNLAARISEYDEKGALTCLKTLLDAGADTRALIKDLADIFRRMMWLAAGADADEDDAELKALAEKYGKAACVRALNILIQKEYEMRQNLRADIVLETAVMALMSPEDDASASNAARVSKLEARLRALEERPPAAVPAAPANGPAPEAPPAAPAPPRRAKARKAEPVSAVSDKEAGAIWEKTLSVLRKTAFHICPYAKQAENVHCTDDVFEIRFSAGSGIAAEFMRQDKTLAVVSKALEEQAGRPLIVRIVASHQAAAPSEGPNIADIFGPDNIEIIEED